MRLSDLCQDLGMDYGQDVAITGLCLHARDAKPGFIFAALAGSKTHGREFIAQAKGNGAIAVLSDPDSAKFIQAQGLIALLHPEPRVALAKMAARFYAPIPKTILAITGTNGKTSGTVFARQLLQQLGHRAASIGTIGIITPDGTEASALTTPDTVQFQQILQSLARRGVTHAAFEAGSHGLHQHRIDGVAADVAAFTNLTRDHLDYHGTMENYFAAKALLFERILKIGGTAVLNRDTAYFAPLAAIAQQRQQQVLSFGTDKTADIRIAAMTPHHDHQQVDLTVMGKTHSFRLPLLGQFQAYNIACAVGMVIGCGENPETVLAAVPHLRGVPGRMQLVARARSGAPIFVDYAHTPDAVENVLRSLRPHCAGKLHIVLGCGGDRDPGKRPLMGALAGELADEVIVTDDNPRSEDPAKIRAAILSAVPRALEIGDRAQAIATSITHLGPQDILVITGKGHEQGQIIGKTTHPFDDVTVAQHAATAQGGQVHD
jgi:UDP-N-acetylmuramoyl-L-alanyl-D-glutamate--2,6-diaminopimelate ligase